MQYKIYTMITSYENAVIVGSLLGDLHIQKNSGLTSRCRLRFCHSIKQKEYVDWKYAVFKKNFCKTTKLPYQTNRDEYLFYTSYSECFVNYHSMWYQNLKKIVPRNIEQLLIDPVALAIWYLDDGTKRNYNACRFATQSFSLQENLLLQSTLETNFKLIVKLEQWWNKKTQKHLYGLYIPSEKESFLTFKNIIYSFVKTEIPSMLYKLE